MLDQSIQDDLKSLSQVFKSWAGLTYVSYHMHFRPTMEQMQDLIDAEAETREAGRHSNKWHLKFDKFLVGWSDRLADGEIVKQKAVALPLEGMGETPRDAIDQIKAKTLDLASGFMLSNRGQEYFDGKVDEFSPHRIFHYRGETLVEKFVFETQKVNDLLAVLNPHKPAATLTLVSV